MKDWFMIVLMLLFFVFMVFIGPFFTIMSLNILFGTQIVFNVYSWLSCFWLGALFITWVKAGTKLAIKESAND